MPDEYITETFEAFAVVEDPTFASPVSFGCSACATGVKPGLRRQARPLERLPSRRLQASHRGEAVGGVNRPFLLSIARRKGCAWLPFRRGPCLGGVGAGRS